MLLILYILAGICEHKLDCRADCHAGCVQSDDVSNFIGPSARIIERMVNQNTFDDVTQGENPFIRLFQLRIVVKFVNALLAKEHECIAKALHLIDLHEYL